MCLAYRQGDISPDHQPYELLLVKLGGRGLRHHLPAPQHRHVLRDSEDLSQLVRDQHDGGAARGHVTQHGEQPRGLLGSQHSRRLVQNEQLGIVVERAEDLGTLTHPDGQRVHDRLRIDAQPVLTAEPCESLDHDPSRGSASPGQRQHDVLGDRERTDEQRRLVHHGDTMRESVTRAPEGDRLAVQTDGSRVRHVQAIDHAHERGLARAVLTHKSVDRLARHPEPDVVVRHQRTEALGQASRLQRDSVGGKMPPLGGALRHRTQTRHR